MLEVVESVYFAFRVNKNSQYFFAAKHSSIAISYLDRQKIATAYFFAAKHISIAISYLERQKIATAYFFAAKQLV